MVFTSLKFLIFLLCTVIVYFICPSRIRWVVLLCASLVFYSISSVEYLPFILITSLISYFVALKISSIQDASVKSLEEAASSEEKKKIKANTKSKCKRYMIGALVIIIGYLMYTKFALKIWKLFNSDVDTAFKVIVPLGISYYTFSTVGYVLDIYWKRYKAEKNFFRYLLYVSYFPHILQGPIARYDRLGFQFKEEHYFDYDRVTKGVQLMVWGFFQKLVIADRISPFVSDVLDNVKAHGGCLLLMAIGLYAVQLYADFDGCVNIARGMSQIFGIELEENFRRPYFSKSVDEYWRRWHMTLGAWFKDYLCMPVSVSGPVKNLSKSVRKKLGNTAGKKTTSVCAVIAVWICTGVWHGTGINYILWGVWQGGIIIFSMIMDEHFEKAKSKLKIKNDAYGWQGFQIIRTFILTAIIPRIITRANSLGDSARIVKRILVKPQFSEVFTGEVLSHGIDKLNMIVLIIAIVMWIVIAIIKEKGVSIRDTIAAKPLPIRWFIYMAGFYIIVIFGVYGPGYDASSFVYMGF